MNLLKNLSIVALFAAVVSCNQSGEMPSPSLSTYNDSLSYSYGVELAEALRSQNISDINADIVAAALKESLKEEAQLSLQECREIISQGAIKEGDDFLAENAQKEGVQTTASGLQYKMIQEGTGASPTATDVVTVHYTGKLIDGTVFDSSLQRGEPATFPLNGVIAGWTEGLQLMKEGGKMELYIPSELGYGARGAGGVIPPNSVLVFEVELISIEDSQP